MKVVSQDGEVFQVPPGSKVFDSQGREIPDPTPVDIPVDCEQPESLESMMMRMINVASRRASRDGLESVDEANDFEVEDEENFEDLLTGAELDAISTARELREEVPKERGHDRSDDSAGDSGGGEEDYEVDEGRQSVGDSVGSGDSEGDVDRSDRRGASVVDNRKERRREPEKSSKDVRKGVGRKDSRR